MFARVAAFEGGDNERLRKMSEEQMASGEMNPPEGIKRVMLLDDDAGSQRLFIAFFDSREAIVAAEARFESMGDEIPEEIRGRRTSVTVYEVALDQSL